MFAPSVSSPVLVHFNWLRVSAAMVGEPCLICIQLRWLFETQVPVIMIPPGCFGCWFLNSSIGLGSMNEYVNDIVIPGKPPTRLLTYRSGLQGAMCVPTHISALALRVARSHICTGLSLVRSSNAQGRSTMHFTAAGQRSLIRGLRRRCSSSRSATRSHQCCRHGRLFSRYLLTSVHVSRPQAANRCVVPCLEHTRQRLLCSTRQANGRSV
jgi:hypothetical protein